MQIDAELYKQIKETIDSFPSYPDLDALIASGDLLKVRGGYNVLSSVGMEAVKKYIISVTAPHNGKPAIVQLSRKRKT